MDVPGRILQLLCRLLAVISGQVLHVLVHRLRDDVEIQPLGRLRLDEIIVGERLRRRVGQPFLDRQAIALGLGNLLAFLVQEELVDKLRRRFGSQDAADFRIDRRIGLVVLAEHLEIDAQRSPAHAEIRLPLQLHPATGHRQRRLGAVLVIKGDRAGLRVDRLHRHVEHAAGLRRDRQEGRIGRLALCPQRRQHDIHDGVILFRRLQQHRVIGAGPVELGCGLELVGEAETVQETPQAAIHVGAIAVGRAEGIGHLGQRLLQVLGQHVLLRQVVGHLAHAVHVV